MLMRFFKILFAIAIVFTVCTGASKKDKAKQVYAFGMAASFSDTTVYFTNIQVLDSVKLRNSFLPLRDLYSMQLEEYMISNGLLKNCTSMIFFSESQKKLEKEAVKLMNKYMKNKGIRVEKLELDKFRFTKPEE